MKFLRKLLAVILVYASMNVAVGGALGLSLLSTYLDPKFYKSIFFEEVLYDAIVDQAVSLFQNEVPELKEIITEESFRNAINRLLPPETLAAIIDEVATQITQHPWPDEVVVSLKKIKENMSPAMDAAFAETGWPANLPRDTIIRELQQNVPEEIRVPVSDIKNRMTPEQEKMAAYLLTNGRIQIPALLTGTLTFLLAAVFFLIGAPRTKALRWVGTALILDGTLIAAVAYSLKEWGGMALKAWGVTPHLLAPVTSYMVKTEFILLTLGAISIFVSIGISRNGLKNE